MWHGDLIRRITDVPGPSEQEKQDLLEVESEYPFCASKYYLSLINWDDPHDPLRRAILPTKGELSEWGSMDASDEQRYTVMPGVQHKYDSTILLLASNMCGSICRYCFRKRIFHRSEILEDLPKALDYIRNHEEITNVLVTGGDPLTLDTDRLGTLISRIREIDHIGIIRIGTRMLSFDPFRILNDPSLPETLSRNISPDKRIYIITHFLHPREITEQAIKAIDLLFRAGVVMANQAPLLRGINDDPETLIQLFKKLAVVGSPQYYMFQCRPASGNKVFAVPVEEGYDIFEKAKSRVSGLAKRARFVMSHATGKIEVIAKTDTNMYFKYHRTPHDEDSGRLMIFERNPDAFWLDDYLDASGQSAETEV